MNFLLRSSTQINPVAADASSGLDSERDYRIERSHSFHGTQFLSGGDAGGGDESKGSGEFGSIWTRMVIEDPADFPAEEGSILVPFRDLPENWASAPDMASLSFLDRDFIFPGEQFHILVHVPADDNASPERITPFKVAAALRAKQGTSVTLSSAGEGIPDDGPKDGQNDEVIGVKVTDDETEAEAKVGGAEESSSSTGVGINFGDSSVPQEGLKRKTQLLLESFRKSHFYVRITGSEGEPQLEKRKIVPDEFTKENDSARGTKELNKPVTKGDNPVLMERGKFNPHAAGGLARNAVACTALANGDIVVLLQISMAADCVTDDAVLEVLQFEKYEPPAFGSTDYGQPQLKRGVWDQSQGLLQWLLPLDRPSSPPPPAVLSSIQNSPTKLAIAGGNSTIFSFSNLRTSSSGQLAAPVSAPILPVPAQTYTPPTYGAKDWDFAIQERKTKTEVGSEGLLSFRGAVLEPQRFSAHCGLEGPHVPGKKWRRKLSIIQPIMLDSYFAQCNAQDLICVLVENVLPSTGRSADVIIYVDSVNIVCQSTAPGSPPLPVPVACVEVGNDQQLPGLALRVGEQHSFILRPTNPALRSSLPNGGKYDSVGSSARYEAQPLAGISLGRGKRGKDTSSPPEGGQYAVIVSCHCSHTESRLHYKHSLQWRPRPPRDLLLSVSLGSSTSDFSSYDCQPLFKPQVVTVQATNLTSQDMNLSLLAPSSLANSPLSMVTFPAPTADSPIPTSFNKQKSFKALASYDEKEKENTLDRPESPDHYLDLPPVRRMESVIGMSPTVLFRERNISAADIVADNSPARTHLWLQSTVPLGCVPAHSTTAVKCDILPLTDGIITLDTLHISANDHDALYIPESPLQIYATSSIATGVA